ncbi:MAG: PIF1 family DEAD/DEAH box helicase [Candidatus Nealsonbacteria bacterium]
MTQGSALDVLKMGYSVFLTGPAGSGKTFLLNKYIKYLKKNKVGVGITASTGIAATHINGRTIHSWAGIGINRELTEKDIARISRQKILRQRISNTKVLVIDEISMLHDYQLDMVDEICRKVKKNSLAFGGIQVILCGDFFQLPPVPEKGKKSYFVNNSKVCIEENIRACYLDKYQYRQKDENFIKLLSQIRKNNVDDNLKDMLLERMHKPIKDFSDPLKFYAINYKVDAINNFKLTQVDGEEKIYDMVSNGPEGLVKSLKKWCLAPEKLILKNGAIVMFLKNNFNAGYINGTTGKVIGFTENNYPIVKVISGREIIAVPDSWVIEQEDGDVLASINQIPLKLAWAITVHKSQGMTLDAAEIDLSRSFEYGMGYVALSRVRSLDGIKLMGLNDLALMVSEDAIKLDKELRENSKKTEKELKNKKNEIAPSATLSVAMRAGTFFTNFK